MLRNVRPIQPIQVLIASRDARFLKVTAFLLARRGTKVESTRKLTELLDVVDQIQPHVVVLDASAWHSAAARRIGALQVLYPRVNIVAVGDDIDGPTFAGVTLLDKWGPVERLQQEVERAYVLGPLAARRA